MRIDNTDKAVWICVDLMLIFLASSTLAYEITLFSKLPLWSCYPLFAIALGAQLFYWIRTTDFKNGAIKVDVGIILLMGLALSCSLLNILTLRPDADDFSFFHRAVYGLLHLDDPIATFHTAHDIKNLPAISPVHLTTSIEVMSALFAEFFGLQPLIVYQLLNGSLCLFLFPLIYYAFFRYFSFSHNYAYLGSIIIVLLYAFSGDSHQDFGNFTVVRAWQGKCILVLLFIPLVALLSYRFIENPSYRDFFRLQMAAICSIGLSGTAFFLIPMVVVFSLLGSALCQLNQIKNFKKYGLLVSSFIPFAIFASLIKLGFIPQTVNTEVWSMAFFHGENKYWTPELISLEQTVFQRKTTLFFYLISLLGLLFLPWKNKRVRALAITSLLISIALITPPISSIIIKITLPAAYWRLAYATQMLLVIAVFTLLCLQSLDQINHLKKIALRGFGICLLILFVVLKSPAVNPSLFSFPPKLKFTSPEIETANQLDKWIPINSTALIPELLIPAIGLLHPTIALISTREAETRHVFLNSDRKNGVKEADDRIAAQKELEECGAKGKIAQIVTELPNLNLLVFPSVCDPQYIETNIKIYRQHWSIKTAGTYQAWLKNAK